MNVSLLCWWLLFVIIFLDRCESTKLLDKAVSIAKTEYDQRKLITVVWWHNSEYDVSDFLKKFDGSVITVNMNTRNQEYVVDCDQFVVFVAHSKEFINFPTLIDKSVITSVYVILILSESKDLDLEIPKLTEIAWFNNITEIIILNKRITNENDITLSTFFPYTPDKCDNHVPVTLPDDTSVFFGKKFKNFHRCPIRVSLTNYIPYVILKSTNATVESVNGMHARLLKLITTILNATFVPKLGSKWEGVGSEINGSWTGSIGHLVEGNVDIVLPAEIINSDRYEAVQISNVFHTYLIVWCLPRRYEIEEKIENYIINSYVFKSFCLSLVPFLTAILLAQKFEKAVRKRESNQHVFLETFAITLGQPFKLTKYWLMNSLFILWVWFSVILRIAYQGEMIRNLWADNLAPFRSLDKALEYVEGYGGIDSILEFYKDTPMEKNFRLLSVADVTLYLEDISNGKRFLLAADIGVIWHYQTRIEILDQPVAYSPAGFFMKARWAAAEEINYILVNLVEAGILDKIKNDYIASELRLRDKALKRKEQNIGLDSILIMMSTLWGYCIFVFLLEIIHYKIKKMKRK